MQKRIEHTIQKATKYLSPSQVITLGFAFVILTGAVLLNLPIASRSGVSAGFLTSLFTATSATCVTGLVVVNTVDQWNLFGETVLLLLIQVGGLGFIAVYVVAFIALGRRISLRSRLVIQASYNQSKLGGMVRLVKRILVFTLIIEGVAALLLAVVFYFSGVKSIGGALHQGIFHAISAFCNAGFDIVGAESLVPYRGNVFINVIIIALIVLGGLGFPVLGELAALRRDKKKRSLYIRWIHLSLHAKITLIMTCLLILLGTITFLALEWGNPETLRHLPPHERVMAALFQSVTLRTCGFATIDQGRLTNLSQFFSCLLMIVGGSSSGTAGGMKTGTLGVIFVAMWSAMRGRAKTEVFGRTVPLDMLQKALTVCFMMLAVVFVGTTLLHFTELNNPFNPSFLDLFFETASASGTVGLTTGLTPHLSFGGRVLMILCMFLGRIGPLTVVVSLNMKQHGQDSGLSYPEERLIIG